MNENLQRITDFINQHHVLTLATTDGNAVSACSLFYAYNKKKNIFIVASDMHTLHIQNIQKNNQIAGNIFLETQEVGKIQGVQFEGVFLMLEDDAFIQEYFNKFPYAREYNPILWKIEVSFFKLTDNTLGFGKKIIWP